MPHTTPAQSRLSCALRLEKDLPSSTARKPKVTARKAGEKRIWSIAICCTPTASTVPCSLSCPRNMYQKCTHGATRLPSTVNRANRSRSNLPFPPPSRAWLTQSPAPPAALAVAPLSARPTMPPLLSAAEYAAHAAAGLKLSAHARRILLRTARLWNCSVRAATPPLAGNRRTEPAAQVIIITAPATETAQSPSRATCLRIAASGSAEEAIMGSEERRCCDEASPCLAV
mmetsp:Transcript_14530/g.28744  ORF Transcript_14530/g.28744 Transcript_14530/m.28744 type:complete len:229 (-) Transcript_14530:393-1079(-)